MQLKCMGMSAQLMIPGRLTMRKGTLALAYSGPHQKHFIYIPVDAQIDDYLEQVQGCAEMT